MEDFIVSYARDVAKKPVEQLTAEDKLNAQRRWVAAASKAPEDLTGAQRRSLVDTVVAFPSVFNDLTDTMKTKLAADLKAAGFTFPAKGESAATRATAERWKSTALTSLNKRWSQSKTPAGKALDPMTQGDYDTAKAAIEASYQAQIGGTTPAPGGPPKAPAGQKPTIPPNYDGILTQNGVRFHVKTDASGKVISSVPVQ